MNKQNGDRILQKAKSDPLLLEARNIIEEYNKSPNNFPDFKSFCHDILFGKNVLFRFNNLSSSFQFVICILVCRELVKNLDAMNTSVGFESEIKHLANFLDQVPIHYAYQSVRTEIQIDRLIKYMSNEVWDNLIDKINNYIEKQFNV